jgi:ribosome biogenesis protein Nip4
VVRQLSVEEIANINRIADHYVQNFKRFRSELKPDPS